MDVRQLLILKIAAFSEIVFGTFRFLVSHRDKKEMLRFLNSPIDMYSIPALHTPLGLKM